MLNIGLKETAKWHRVGSYAWGTSLVSRDRPSRGTSLAMETKPMRDEMKPEGCTKGIQLQAIKKCTWHDMMGMPLTSWHGHRRTSLAMAERRNRLAKHLGDGVLMSREHMK